MHIVFLNPIGQVGGAERSLLDMLASLRKAQPDWKLSLIVGELGLLTQLATEIGVETHVAWLPRKLAVLGDSGIGGPAGHEVSRASLFWRLGMAGFSAANYAKSLRQILASLQPDLIHTNGFKMHILGAWAKPANAALVWHIHDYVRSRQVMAKLLRMHASRCSAVIANSESVAGDVSSICDARLIHTIWNAVDLEEFSPLGDSLDIDAASALSPAPAGVIRVGLVGTFAKWKGHDAFLRAVALLPADLPIRGYIVGGPVYQTDASQWSMDDLRRTASKLGLAGKVGFTGYVARSAEAIRALDIVVHASTKPEPFGLVIAEAMACQRALIVSNVGGAAEIVHDGVDALTCPLGNVERLARLIEQLAQNCDLRERLGIGGRKTAERDFDRSRLGPQLAEIYRSTRVGRNAAAA